MVALMHLAWNELNLYAYHYISVFPIILSCVNPLLPSWMHSFQLRKSTKLNLVHLKDDYNVYIHHNMNLMQTPLSQLC